MGSHVLGENARPLEADWLEIPFMKTSAELEQQAALQVASLMAAAARTAPKTRGIDNIRVVGIEDPATKARLVSKMRELAKTEERPWFERDASCVEKSSAVLLVGVAANPADLDCGYCGQGTCEAGCQYQGTGSNHSFHRQNSLQI